MLMPLALRLLSLPPSAASAERNWSMQDYIISKRRNRLAPLRAEKLTYIYFNTRSLRQVHMIRGQGITDEALARWHSSLLVHAAFRWPTDTDGRDLYQWDEEPLESEDIFAGMHGDDSSDDSSDESEDERTEGMALYEFVPNDVETPGEGFTLMPCPARLPHDLVVGTKIARWFGHPFNAWYVGTIGEVNRRRTKTENVSARFFTEEEGETLGMFLADADSYGPERLWVLLTPVPVDVDADDSDVALDEMMSG